MLLVPVSDVKSLDDIAGESLRSVYEPVLREGSGGRKNYERRGVGAAVLPAPEGYGAEPYLGKNNRKKNAGMAKWHNFTIGGVKADGTDATNEMTYMLLDAAAITKTPHHTLTLRVHKGTPEKLMIRALEVVRMGMGLPAFIGDESYIKTFTSRGLPIEDAREYVMTGCLDANIPGKSRTGPVPMVTMPLIFDIFRHNGVDVKTGKKCGIETGNFEAFESYEDFYQAYLKQVDYIIGIMAEKDNVELTITRELLPDPLRSALMGSGHRIRQRYV